MTQFEFVQSGFSTSLERYIPLYKDKKEVSNLIFVVAIVYLTFGLFFSSGVYILDYFKLFSFLNSNDTYEYIILLIFFVPLIWFFKTFSFALRAFKDFRTENLVNISFLLIEAVLVYIAIKNNYKLNEILFINLICLFLRYCTHTIFVFTRHRFNIFSVRTNSLISQFEKVKSYSFWNFISAVSGTIINVSDKLLVSIFLGAASLPLYYGVNQFIKFYTIVSSIINSSIIPHFSNKVFKYSNKEFNDLALKGTEYTSIISMFISAVFILFSQFIFIFVSKEFLFDYLLIFNIGLFLYALIGVREFTARLYVCKIEGSRLISKFGLLTAFLYPIIFIITSTKYGLNGAVLSPILSHLLVLPFWLHLIFRLTGLNIKKYLNITFNIFFKMFFLFAPFYIINHLFKFNSEIIILLVELIIIAFLGYTIFSKSINKLLYSFK